MLEVAVARLLDLVAFVRRGAAAGDAAQQAILARGDVALYERDISYLERGLTPFCSGMK